MSAAAHVQRATPSHGLREVGETQEGSVGATPALPAEKAGIALASSLCSAVTYAGSIDGVAGVAHCWRCSPLRHPRRSHRRCYPLTARTWIAVVRGIVQGAALGTSRMLAHAMEQGSHG